MAKKKTNEPKPEPAPPSAGAEYTVLARRYRPQQFSDLVGQEAVAQALSNALESGRVAHAYLFTGMRGVGKTSAARILAKALNCVKGPTATPCDECEICQAITSGEDTDVIEIDGASNRRIEEIREIRANVHYRPSRSRFKIYIIDEVHMLTKESFNALLKTLEEPPPHVKFIFATTEARDVPITILSRCQRFDFGGISIPLILDRLKGIVASEGMSADDEALEPIARRAGGSMRDAQSLLDQLLAFSGKKLTLETVHQLLGTAHEERVMAIAEAVFGRDPKKVLEEVNDIVNRGQQLGELMDQLIEYWRDLMVVNSAGMAGQEVSVSSARRPTLEKHAGRSSLDTILAGMDILVTAKTRMHRSSHTRAILEMALLRLCQLDNLLQISQIAQMLSSNGGPTPAKPRGAIPAGVASEPEKKKLAPEISGETNGFALAFQQESIEAIWQQLLEKSGFATQSDLRKAISTAISGPNTLVLRVPRRYNGPQSIYGDPARLAKVEETLAAIVAQPSSIRIEWVEESAETSTGPGRSTTAVSLGQQRQLRSELMQIPFVKKAADLLGAQIIRADEGFGVPAQAASTATEESPEEG